MSMGLKKNHWSTLENFEILENEIQNGAHENLTSGNAEQLMSTTGVTDKVPYLFRPSAGDGADREQDKIVGGTVAWNQLVSNATYTNSSITDTRTYVALWLGGITIATVTEASTINKIVAATVTSTANLKHSGATTDIPLATGIPVKNGHKYLVHVKFNGINPSVLNGLSTEEQMVSDLTQDFGSTIADYLYTLERATPGAGVAWFRKLFPNPYYAYNAGELISVAGLQSHDMTGFNQLDEEIVIGGIDAYGQNVADATGRLWRTVNFIPVIGGLSYYSKIADGYTTSTSNNTLFCYNINKEFLRKIDNVANAIKVLDDNVAFVRLSFYYTTIRTEKPEGLCFNLSNRLKNGTYQPYVKRTYALDSDLTLRGIPKLDSNNKLYYDGDTYEADGTVTRRYGIVDLGTLTWGYNSISLLFYTSLDDGVHNSNSGIHCICEKYRAVIGYGTDGINTTSLDKVCNVGSTFQTFQSNLLIRDTAYTDAAAFKTAMSGVYLVYELATPTTEQADPYQTPQILDPNGTEAYIDTRTVPIPVGHETFYPQNLRSKIEGLPKNFSTLIAPTEQTYKATQAYSSGALFIVNNILYKATASIANGAAITPGTNCQATTLAAVIAALA